MKRFYLLSALIVFTNIVNNGQVEKPFTMGHFFFGGSISLDRNKIEWTYMDYPQVLNHNEININTDLYLGIFVYNYITAGMKFDLWINRYKFSTGAPEYYNVLLLEPFIRFYAPFGLFGEGAIGYGFDKFGLGTTDTDDKKMNKWNMGLGYSLFINKNIAIEPVFSYGVIKKTEMEDQTIEKIKFLNLHIGIQLYFDLSKKKSDKM